MKKLPLRKNVMGLVFSGEEFLIVQKTNYMENRWSLAGGGVDKGETGKEALERELKEELGTDKFKIIGKSKVTYSWEWPAVVIRKRGNKHRGQDAEFFYVRFLGKKEDIDIDQEEIRRAKWIKKNDFEDHFLFPGQLDVMEKLVQEFEKAPGGD